MNVQPVPLFKTAGVSSMWELNSLVQATPYNVELVNRAIALVLSAVQEIEYRAKSDHSNGGIFQGQRQGKELCQE